MGTGVAAAAVMNPLVHAALAADARANALIDRQMERTDRAHALGAAEEIFDRMRADGLDAGELETVLARLESLGMDTSAIRAAGRCDVEQQLQRSVARFRDQLSASPTEMLSLQIANHASLRGWAAASDASANAHELRSKIIGNLKA